MSLLTHARALGRHRGKTPHQLRTELDAAICTGLAQQTFIAELAAERNRLEAQLDQAGIDRSGTLEDLQAMTADRDRLQLELIEARAELANATRVTVPPMERDTSNGADQATGPIDVRPLQEAAAAGLLSPVIHVSTSGASADPGQPPRAAGRGVDDTQPLNTVGEVA